MPTLCRTAEKCRKCPNVSICNNKRMEACALAEFSKPIVTNLTAPHTSPLSASIARPYTPINIKMGEHGTINTSLEEINKQIEKSFSDRFNINCAINKS